MSDQEGLAIHLKEVARNEAHVKVSVFIGDRDGSRPNVGTLTMDNETWDRLVGGAPVGGQPKFRRMATWGLNHGGEVPNAFCVWLSEPHLDEKARVRRAVGNLRNEYERHLAVPAPVEEGHP